MDVLRVLTPLGIALYFFSDGLHLVGTIFIVAAAIAALQVYQRRQASAEIPESEPFTDAIGTDAIGTDARLGTGTPINLEPHQEAAVKTMLNAGHTLGAIKEVRRVSGAGLKASKEYVEELEV